ncbi:hypothetical protein [Rhodoflexus sp.]
MELLAFDYEWEFSFGDKPFPVLTDKTEKIAGLAWPQFFAVAIGLISVVLIFAKK